MKDIKVLKNMVQLYKDCGINGYPDVVIDFSVNKYEIQAIENLIKRNKELEKLARGVEKIRDLKLPANTEFIIVMKENYLPYIEEDYIPKSKVRVLIEKYRAFGWHNKDDEYWANRILDGFEGLLQKEINRYD